MLELFRAGSLSWLTSMKIETVLIAISGAMALTTAFTSYRNTHAHKYRLLVIGSSDVDVIDFSCLSLAAIGLFNASFGVFKVARKCAMSRNQYIAVVVVSLVGNFIIGVVLSEHKNRVMHGLEMTMMQQLKESVETKNRFGVGFASSEAWDIMQTKMMCCGVNGYKDYMQLGRISVDQNTVVPVSCCAMRQRDSMPVPDNLSQCQLDARQNVVNSVFLNTQGCYGPLSRWLVRLLNKLTAMVFATVCIQAVSVFYLVWLVYRRSIALQRPR